MGVGIAGTPIPTLGFNRDVAWTHTVTAARHFTLHALVLDPADPTRYMLDGQSIAMEPRTVSVPMPDGVPDVTRTLYSTRFGPVFVAPDSGVIWSANGLPMRCRMQTATMAARSRPGSGSARPANVGEIKAAVSDTLGIPWVNTIASDRHGDALHADITAVPNVSAQLIAACSTPLSPLFASLATLLDGSRSECDWQTAEGTPEPGLMPASDQAATIVRDYLTNSNDSYWLSNPRLPHPQLSPVLGKHAAALSLRTRSNFTETEALLAAGKVDHARAKAMAFANKEPCRRHDDRTAAGAVCRRGGAGRDHRPRLRGRCGAGTAATRRTVAARRCFVPCGPRIGQRGDLWQVAFDPADPVNTPRDLATEGSTGEQLLAALGEAVAELDAAAITLDAPWGEVQRWTANGEAIPIHGGPGTAGVLNYQDARPAPGGGTRAGARHQLHPDRRFRRGWPGGRRDPQLFRNRPTRPRPISPTRRAPMPSNNGTACRSIRKTSPPRPSRTASASPK